MEDERDQSGRAEACGHEEEDRAVCQVQGRDGSGREGPCGQEEGDDEKAAEGPERVRVEHGLDGPHHGGPGTSAPRG